VTADATPAQKTPGILAFTGTDTGIITELGLGLWLAGLIVMLTTRRRRRRTI
jgi:hypothetical protein